MEISQNFDGGNISVIECSDPAEIQLEIKKDNNSDFYQWFYFRLSGAKNQQCVLNILNAIRAAYPEGFQNYRVLYSYDRKKWLRHSTEFNGEVEAEVLVGTQVHVGGQLEVALRVDDGLGAPGLEGLVI